MPAAYSVGYKTDVPAPRAGHGFVPTSAAADFLDACSSTYNGLLLCVGYM